MNIIKMFLLKNVYIIYNERIVRKFQKNPCITLHWSKNHVWFLKYRPSSQGCEGYDEWFCKLQREFKFPLRKMHLLGILHPRQGLGE